MGPPAPPGGGGRLLLLVEGGGASSAVSHTVRSSCEETGCGLEEETCAGGEDTGGVGAAAVPEVRGQRADGLPGERPAFEPL